MSRQCMLAWLRRENIAESTVTMTESARGQERLAPITPIKKSVEDCGGAKSCCIYCALELEWPAQKNRDEDAGGRRQGLAGTTQPGCEGDHHRTAWYGHRFSRYKHKAQAKDNPVASAALRPSAPRANGAASRAMSLLTRGGPIWTPGDMGSFTRFLRRRTHLDIGTAVLP